MNFRRGSWKPSHFYLGLIWMSVNSDVQMLQRVPLFSKVDPAHLQVMVFSSKRETINEGSFVFKKGKTGAAAYFVLSGRGVVRSSNDSSSPIIARVEKGTLLAETSMVGGIPYSISVQADKKMQVLKLTNETFTRICEEFPEVGKEVLGVLADKLDQSLKGFSDVQHKFETAKSFSNL